MRIPKEQLDQMHYKVHKIPKDKGIGDVYPEFKRYPAFSAPITTSTGRKANGLDTEFVVRYIVLLWAIDSPIREIPDFEVRKEIAIEIVAGTVEKRPPAEALRKLAEDEFLGVGEIEIAFTLFNGGPMLAEYMSIYKLMNRVMLDTISPLYATDKFQQDKVTSTLKQRMINSKGLKMLRNELEVLAKQLWPERAEIRKRIDAAIMNRENTSKGTLYVAESLAEEHNG